MEAYLGDHRATAVTIDCASVAAMLMLMIMAGINMVHVPYRERMGKHEQVSSDKESEA